MEVKLTGFVESINNISDKKNKPNQDEFSEIFSALLLNIIPNLNGQTLGNSTTIPGDTSISINNINSDYLKMDGINQFTDLSKIDPNFIALINDFKALVTKENNISLSTDILKLNNLINEFEETVKPDVNDEFMNKLTDIISSLENNSIKKGDNGLITKFTQPFKAEIGTDIDMPLLVEQHFESKLNLIEKSDSQGIDIKTFDMVKNDNETQSNNNESSSIIGKMVENKSAINQSSVTNVEVNKNANEISRLISKPEDLIDIAVEKFKSLRLPDRTELNVKLRPEELGEITVKLVLERGQVNGNIIAENRDVVNMLRAQIDGLKQELKSNNVNLNSLNVNVSSDNLFSNGRGEKEFSHNNSSNSRKYIHLDDLAPGKEEEGFTIMA